MTRKYRHVLKIFKLKPNFRGTTLLPHVSIRTVKTAQMTDNLSCKYRWQAYFQVELEGMTEGVSLCYVKHSEVLFAGYEGGVIRMFDLNGIVVHRLQVNNPSRELDRVILFNYQALIVWLKVWGAGTDLFIPCGSVDISGGRSIGRRPIRWYD